MGLKAVQYINQFYAGVGGETMADTPFTVISEKKGPAAGLEPLFKGEMTITKVVYCGDNYVNTDENWPGIQEQIRKVIEEEKPDVFLAGPAFNAGRYGVACAKVCDFVRRELGVPSLTGMWWENPAVGMYVKDNYIISTPETATGMRKALPVMAALALKLAKGEEIGPARVEGYLETGHRNNAYVAKSGAERVVDMVVGKLYGKPYQTEVPHRGFEQVPPAPPVRDISRAKIALFTTGGLVPVGNPDKIKQAFAVSYGVYDMTGLDALKKGEFESIHGGYDTTFVSNDPHRLVPMDVVKDCVEEGVIGQLYPFLGSTCGVGTNVASGQKMGADWAKRLKDAGVTAAILTST